MLRHNKLLIDRDCPMCNVYGACFRKMGWVDDSTLTTYQQVEEKHTRHIDMDRAKNEIALLDSLTGNTTYGLDALIKIATHDKPAFWRILNMGPIYFILSYLYNFISYNRKVVAPAPASVSGRDCTPDFHLKYRIAYIIFVALFTGIVLNIYAYHIQTDLGFPHDWSREYYICFGQIFWQLAAVSYFNTKKKWDYLGNMSTVSMLGGILLLPVILLLQYISISVPVLLLIFALVVGVMFFEHIRRCKLMGLPIWMTVSWVGYRSFVLGVVLWSLS